MQGELISLASGCRKRTIPPCCKREVEANRERDGRINCYMHSLQRSSDSKTAREFWWSDALLGNESNWGPGRLWIASRNHRNLSQEMTKPCVK